MEANCEVFASAMKHALRDSPNRYPFEVAPSYSASYPLALAKSIIFWPGTKKT